MLKTLRFRQVNLLDLRLRERVFDIVVVRLVELGLGGVLLEHSDSRKRIGPS